MEKKWISGREILDRGVAPFEIAQAVVSGELHPVSPRDGEALTKIRDKTSYIVPDDGFIDTIGFAPRVFNYYHKGNENRETDFSNDIIFTDDTECSSIILEEALFLSDEVYSVMRLNKESTEVKSVDCAIYKKEKIDVIVKLLTEKHSVEEIAYLLRENMPGRGRGGKASWATIGRAIRGHGHQDSKTYEDYAKALYNAARAKMI